MDHRDHPRRRRREGHGMSGAPTAASRRRQAALMRALNLPMRQLLALPIPIPLSGRLMLVFHTGRNSGRRYRQPVSYVTDGDTLLTPGGGRWTLNLTAGQPTRLRRRGKDLYAIPELVDDPDRVERLLGVLGRANRSLDRFVRIPKDPDGHYQRAALQAAIDHGFRIVRWHLEDCPRPSSG